MQMNIFIAITEDLLKKNSNVDIAFMMDSTASMGKNINGTKSNVASIVDKVKDTFKVAKVRVAFVAYRDYTEGPKRFEIMDFTDDIPSFIDFIGTIRAFRGGDIPEDVLGALNQTINLNWTAANKLFFQIGIVLKNLNGVYCLT